MTKYLITAVALSVALAVATSTNFAQEKEKKYEPKCPVSGKKIDKTKFVEFNGGKVYFCCENCPKKFEEAKEGGKFAAKANMQMVGLGECKQVKCPFTGKDLNPATKTNIQGVNVCFCCNNCKGKASDLSGAAQVSAIFNNAAFKKGWEIKKTK
jgi:YHS domain-containing protein